MCLEAIQDIELAGKKVLDLGCGSGILGIGARVLGCASVVGCDIDPKAPDVAAGNAALNGIGSDVFKVYAGDIICDASLRAMLGTGYDIVLANIVADVIIPLSALASDFMAEGALFICSGIIDNRVDEVKAALEGNGFAIIKHRHEEEWNCFACRRA
jgi:ribosomal protein L11 methyltransferase